jgi:Uma2 family endonuclease
MSATPLFEEIEDTPMLDDEHYEIVNSRRVQTPWMDAYDGWVANVLMLGLAQAARGLGRPIMEALFVLDEANMRRPDMAFVSYSRWPRAKRLPSEDAWDVIPDLVAEVVNRRDKASEMIARIEEYFRAGVRLVWLVFPRQRLVQVWGSSAANRVVEVGDVLEGGDVVPGFRLDLTELFDEGDD